MNRAALSVLDPLNEKPYSLLRSAIACARSPYPEDTSRKRQFRIAEGIWREGYSVTKSPQGAYLESLGIKNTDGLNHVLRSHHAILHKRTGTYYPALIAAVRNSEGEFTGILRTYLMHNGKAWVHAQKPQPLGNCVGSFVQLGRPSHRMILASSLETALMLHHACPEYSVWSSMSRGNLKAPMPKNVKEVIFCVDNDADDSENAEKIVNDAVRIHEERGQHIKIAQPPKGWRFQDMYSAE